MEKYKVAGVIIALAYYIYNLPPPPPPIYQRYYKCEL